MNKLYMKLAEALEEGRKIEWLTSPDDGKECLIVDGEPAFGSIEGSMSATAITTEPTLLLIGAGHIGKALYDLASLQGMRTIVLDDRAEELTEERFPEAERYVGPFDELLQKRYAHSPYIVIFTHGHSYDLEALRYALSEPFSYLGMIGSKAKAASQIETVTAEGFDSGRIKAIHSPIGIPINAVTPEEIAISIMAEIISTLRKDKDAVILSPALARRAAEGSCSVARIIGKHGSAPRSIGSMMVITEDSTYSTIGGGRVESIVIDEGRKLLSEGPERKVLRLDLSKGGNAGMICGGSVTVLLTRL